MTKNRERKRYGLWAAVIILALTASLTVFLVQKEQELVSRAQQVPPAGFVYREGNKLMLNGKPYQTASFNSFQLSGCGNANQIPNAEQIETLFASLPDNIMIRTWAFPGNTAATESVIKSAEKHNIKILVSLGDGRSHCGHADGAPSGDGSGKTTEWYASGYQAQYLPHVTKMTTTYKDSPAIGMWEILNEAGDADVATLKQFFDAVAAEIKKNDPNHLVTSGTFPPYAYDGEAGYESIHSGPNIDVGSIHEYDYDFQDSNTIESPHFAPALSVMNKLNKPLIVGETGINAAASGCRTDLQTRADAMKQKFDVYLSKGAGGVFAWNYAQEPDNCGSTFGATDPLVEVFKTYKANLDAAGSGAAPTSPFVTPSFFPLAPCPTCATPSASPMLSSAPAPTANQTAPTGVSITTNPSPVKPCETEGASLASHKSKHKKKKGGISQGMEEFIKLLMELINMIIKLLGGAPIGTPNKETPQPETPAPTQESPESPESPTAPIIPTSSANPTSPNSVPTDSPAVPCPKP